MPDITEHQIGIEPPNPPTRAPVYIIAGYILFGLALISMSLVLQRSFTKYAEAQPAGSPNRDTTLPTALDAVFFVFGVCVAGVGSINLATRLRNQRIAAAHPGETWYADFPWKPEGERERPIAAIGGYVLGFFMVAVLAAPFNTWAFGAGAPAGLVVLVVIADLVFLTGFAFVALRVARKIRYGAAFIRYERFPFFLGQRLDVRVGAGRPLPAGAPVTVTLRFIEERLGRVGFRSRNTFHQLYADEKKIDPAGALPREGMVLSFPLPAGEYATAISAPYMRFWQIHLHASASGADYDETFLVPVYRHVA